MDGFSLARSGRRLASTAQTLLGATCLLAAGCIDDDLIASRLPAVPTAPLAAPNPVQPAPTTTIAEDAGTGPSPAVDAGPCGALFCTDFEQPLDPSQVRVSDGTLELDSAQSRSGNSSLKVSTGEPGGSAFLSVPLPPIFSGGLSVRVFALIQEETELHDLVLFHLSDNDGDEGINVDLWTGDRFELFLPADQLGDFSDPGSVQRDVWMCLVLNVEVDDSDGRAELLLDNERIALSNGVDTLPPEGISRLGLGASWSDGDQPNANLFLDDVVASRESLDCP